jgi:histidinol phosphatase-like enzyme
VIIHQDLRRLNRKTRCASRHRAQPDRRALTSVEREILPFAVAPCDCRKPRPGLYRQAAEDHEIDLSRSFYVGDRVRDVAAGIAAGGTGYLIRPGADSTTSEMPAHAIPVKSLQDAVERLLESGLFD